jgi:hypothetical protein
MVVQGGKSAATILLDSLRHIIILAATGYTTFAIWRWSWIAAALALIPVYIIMLNVFGFLTLPLYLLTPETRHVREMERAILSGKQTPKQ